MILTLKKEKGWSSGPVQLDHPGSRRRVVESHLQTIRARRALDHPPWSKVVQGGPAWSRVVQSESSRVGPSLRADSAAHSARQAAGSNRGELSGTQRGMRRRSQRVSERRGASPGWRALDHAGPPPTWSKVVQCGPCGPGSAVCEGGSPSSRSDVQTTRKAISRRLAEFGPVRQGIPIDLLGGPPPGLASRESLPGR